MVSYSGKIDQSSAPRLAFVTVVAPNLPQTGKLTKPITDMKKL